MKLSPRVQALEPSATLRIDSRAKQLRKEGVDVVNFSAGEPDFDTPTPIADAAIRAIQSGKTRYTPAGGIPELRLAISEKLKRENNLKYSPEEVMATNGAKQALHNTLQVLVSTGDEVLILSPYWVSFPELVTLSGGRPVVVPTTPEGRPDPEAIRNAMTPKTIGLIINSPNNPSGNVYTRPEMESIVQLAIEKNIWILSDEVYEKLVFGESKHISPAHISPEAKSKTVLVSAVSKSFAMTGWRIGYLAGPKEIVSAAEKLQGHSTGNPNTPAQYAALAALRGEAGLISNMIHQYGQRRLAITTLLNKIEGIECPTPQGAFYVFPNVSALYPKKRRGQPIGNSMNLAQLLLEEAKVATVPGSVFGTDEHLRLSYATSMDQIEEGTKRIQKFAKELEGDTP